MPSPEFQVQMERVKSAIHDIEKAEARLRKANVDGVPDDLQGLAGELKELVEDIQSRVNGHAMIYQLRDYQKPA